MSRCESFRESLTLYASGDLEAATRAPLEDHVGRCAACARELQEVRTMLGGLTPDLLYPREGEVDWDGFAAATVARLRVAAPRVVPFRRRAPRWLAPATLARAAAVILAVGVAVLFLRRAPELGAPEAAPEAGSPAVAADQASAGEMLLPDDFQARLEYHLARRDTRAYLEASRTVLVQVLESPVRCAKNEIDISAEREKSIELLRRQKRLRASLDRPELARAQEVCNQLEGILTEITTLRDCADLDRIQEIRDAVRRNQLLVKIGVLESELGGSYA